MSALFYLTFLLIRTINRKFEFHHKLCVMKTRLTLLFFFIVTIAQAQYDYSYNDPMFGVGVGYNFTSIVDDDVRPIELSFKCRIDDDHLLQLYVPFLKQDDSFKSIGHPEMELIATLLDTKKRLYGIGLEYDYVLQSFFLLDFVVGLRADCQLYKYRTDLTNTYPSGSAQSSNALNASDHTFRDIKNLNFVVSPNVGMRVNVNKFSIDAKFLLSMLSMRGDVDNLIEAKEPALSSAISTSREWTEDISNKFKLKMGIMVSMSYFF